MPKLLTVPVAAAVAASVVLAAAPAHAAPPKVRDHVVAVAGSDGYLVYKVAKSTKDIQVYGSKAGALYSRDAKGRVAKLTGFTPGVGVIQQTGHSLIEKTYVNIEVDGGTSGVERLRQRDLSTGKESQTTLAPFDSLASVAPDGYLLRHDLGNGDAGTTTLTYRHFDGTTANIAVPFADNTNYVLQASDTGLLAVTPSDDEETRPSRIAYMTWADPGTWRPIYNAGQLRYISCSTPSSTHVACRIDGYDSPGLGLALFRLRDGHATWLQKTHPKACAYIDYATKGTNLYALETSDKSICTKGKLYRLQDDGKLISGSTKYRYNTLGGITTAYRKSVLSGGDQAHLYTTTGVTQKPVAIVKG